MGKNGIIKAPFWNSADKRHLTTFESKAKTSTRTGFLSLVPLPGGLPLA